MKKIPEKEIKRDLPFAPYIKFQFLSISIRMRAWEKKNC